MTEVAQIDGRERFNKLRTVSKIRPLLNRLKFIAAVSIPLTLITTCDFFQSTEITVRYPEECNQPYPKVCVDLRDWQSAKSASVTWKAPEGTLKNNIFERDSFEEQPEIIAGIGPQKILILANSGLEDVQKLEVTLETGLVLAVNPQMDHYLSIQACRAADDCISSEEVKIPKIP